MDLRSIFRQIENVILTGGTLRASNATEWIKARWLIGVAENLRIRELVIGNRTETVSFLKMTLAEFQLNSTSSHCLESRVLKSDTSNDIK